MSAEASEMDGAKARSTHWGRLRNAWLNHPVGIVVTVLALAVPAVLAGWQLFEDRIAPAIPPKLEVKVLPGFEGGAPVEGCSQGFEYERRRLLTHGARVAYALSSSRPDDTEPVTVVSIKPEVRF